MKDIGVSENKQDHEEENQVEENQRKKYKDVTTKLIKKYTENNKKQDVKSPNNLRKADTVMGDSNNAGQVNDNLNQVNHIEKKLHQVNHIEKNLHKVGNVEKNTQRENNMLQMEQDNMENNQQNVGDTKDVIVDKKEKNNLALYKHLLFPAFFCYLEFMFHILVYKSIDITIIFPMLFGVVAGCVIDFWTSCFNDKINKIIGWIALSIGCLVFATQLVYNHIFKTFLSIYSVGQNGADVMEFWKEAVLGILAVLPGLLLLFLPLLVFYVSLKRWFTFQQESLKIAYLPLGGALVLHLITVVFLYMYGIGAHTPYDLYFNKGLMDLSARKLGLITSIRSDISNVVFGNSKLVLDNQAFAELHPVPTFIVTDEISSEAETLNELTPGASSVTITPAPTQIPIDSSPNILDIDFTQLAENEKNDTIKTLHAYFSMAQPTKKNEYSGMFEGYNLIFLTAEGFSPWAVDKEVTPTLYRLTNEGFVFRNFYTPIWYTSTSDGEYVACTGLIPSGTNSFSKSSDNSLPFCFGWQFQKLGYSARAYHNHSYKYYNRNLTHPNMGYDYKGAGGGGLEVKETWPESDLEMMQVTIPEFINDSKFHVYYMTVSGHMYYTFAGNSMAAKNKSYVEDLPYSNNVKAYVASQKELDLALEYLIQELDKKGVLDKTVIALSADHYPYGLTNEEISEVAGHPIEENFELYKNNFILWNVEMDQPIVVDKYCSSLDIMPTLSNLFGISYDSRLFMGQDILSDATPLIMFGNQSFITDQIMYNSQTGDITKLTNQELPEDYVKKYISVVKNKFNVSASILKNNYFSYLPLDVKNKDN